MNHIWVLAHDAMVFGLELKEKNVLGLIEKMHNFANELRRRAANNQQKIREIDVEIDNLRGTVQEETRGAAWADAAADKCNKFSLLHLVPIVNIFYTIDCNDSSSSHRNNTSTANYQMKYYLRWRNIQLIPPMCQIHHTVRHSS